MSSVSCSRTVQQDTFKARSIEHMIITFQGSLEPRLHPTKNSPAPTNSCLLSSAWKGKIGIHWYSPTATSIGNDGNMKLWLFSMPSGKLQLGCWRFPSVPIQGRALTFSSCSFRVWKRDWCKTNTKSDHWEFFTGVLAGFHLSLFSRVFVMSNVTHQKNKQARYKLVFCQWERIQLPLLTHLLPFKNLSMSADFGIKTALLAKFTQSLNCTWLPTSLRETYDAFLCSSVPLVYNTVYILV